ncbi:hypothetical protein BGW42_001873 [Actinomortierella wolfii]|nr:hypothetical protein BGW42_001873 [Actinomortierella wolfii]
MYEEILKSKYPNKERIEFDVNEVLEMVYNLPDLSKYGLKGSKPFRMPANGDLDQMIAALRDMESKVNQYVADKVPDQQKVAAANVFEPVKQYRKDDGEANPAGDISNLDRNSVEEAVEGENEEVVIDSKPKLDSVQV